MSLREIAHTKSGVITIIALVVALLGMLPFLYIELCTFKEYGLNHWFNIWNIMDILSYVFQVRTCPACAHNSLHRGIDVAVLATAMSATWLQRSHGLRISIYAWVRFPPYMGTAAWRGTGCLLVCAQITITVMYFARIKLDDELMSVLLAAQVLLLYWKFQYFARCDNCAYVHLTHPVSISVSTIAYIVGAPPQQIGFP